MNFFKFRQMEKQFPFLSQALWYALRETNEGFDFDEARLDNSLATIRVEQADERLLTSVGKMETYWGSRGGSVNYTVYVAVCDAEFRMLEFNVDRKSGSGRDDEQWDDAQSIGQQLAATGINPMAILELRRSQSHDQRPRRELIIHKMSDRLLPNWSREQFHKAADELASELEAALAS